MSKICPECGREFSSLSQSVKCPICKCALVDDGGANNSEPIRKQRLNKSQEQRPNQIKQSEIQEVELIAEPVQNGVSTLGIIALIFSLLGCVSFAGTILAIIDLCIKDGKKKVCSIIALVITCLWCLIAIIIVGFGDNKPKAVSERTDSKIANRQTQESNVQVNEPVKDTFGLIETAEMNNVQVTMMNYEEDFGSEWNMPADGNVFVLVEFEIANNSSSDLAISSMLSFETYVDDYSTSLSLGALMENEHNQLDGIVAPGKKMRGWIGYEIPSNWDILEIHFTDNIWSNNKFKFAIQR